MWPLSVIVTGIVDDERVPVAVAAPASAAATAVPVSVAAAAELWATGLTAVILPLTTCVVGHLDRHVLADDRLALDSTALRSTVTTSCVEVVWRIATGRAAAGTA